MPTAPPSCAATAYCSLVSNYAALTLDYLALHERHVALARTVEQSLETVRGQLNHVAHTGYETAIRATLDFVIDLRDAVITGERPTHAVPALAAVVRFLTARLEDIDA